MLCKSFLLLIINFAFNLKSQSIHFNTDENPQFDLKFPKVSVVVFDCYAFTIKL